jgi:hypothetical protein
MLFCSATIVKRIIYRNFFSVLAISLQYIKAIYQAFLGLILPDTASGPENALGPEKC